MGAEYIGKTCFLGGFIYITIAKPLSPSSGILTWLIILCINMLRCLQHLHALRLSFPKKIVAYVVSAVRLSGCEEKESALLPNIFPEGLF